MLPLPTIAMIFNSEGTIPIPMSSLKLVFLCVFISFQLNFSIARAQQPVLLEAICSSNKTFANNSAYQFKLRTLLSSLSSNATGNTEFFNATVAGTDNSDRTYGLFMCRGDVSSQLCQRCVVNATKEIASECPNSKEAIVWYDECLLRYSNRSIFSTVDLRPTHDSPNAHKATDQQSFMQLVYNTMNETADEAASSAVGLKKYATKQANISGFQTLYSLAQCTPDLSPQDCRNCLSVVIGLFFWCCMGKIGGRVLTPSCNVRYELYRFYGLSAPAPAPTTPGLVPPSPSATSQENSGMSSGTIVAIVVPIAVAVLLFIVGICFLYKRGKKKSDSVSDGKSANDMTAVESLQYDFSTIEAATDNFSTDNKLGEGGFGEVYKGTLPNGQIVAVKRLLKGSGQGAREFKNEVEVVAKLQHRNLVRLLGFCVDGEEKILVYEFVPNKSLDFILFNPEKQKELDWTKRYKIIGGIARGIQYLRQDSRLRIIHRDLKASNVLLDGDMNPKVSDFGMARIVQLDQTQGTTSRIVGTYGYMAPEYAMQGEFSVKSDVYSFGVLIMEIINGKKNSSFYQTDGAEDLLTYAWKLWKDGAPLDLLDPTLRASYTPNEVMRCIHIGLLCVQEDPADRPTMASIVLALESYSVTLPAPQQPAFFLHSVTDSNMPMHGLQSVQHTTKSTTMSVNEMSISEMDPR